MHSIYRLSVGGQDYIGYTSRDPQVRLKEHLETARAQKWKHNSKLYPMLVEMEYEYEFEVIFETENEIYALLREIWEIRQLNGTSLNNSRGGEGATVVVKSREFKNGNIQYKIVPRKKPRAPTKAKKVTRRRRRRR